MDQAWRYAQVAAALHDASGAYYGTDSTVRIDEAGQSKPIKAAPTTAKAQHRKITSKRNAAAILSRSSLWRPVAIRPLLYR
jgi:hypothetical protein